MTIPQKNLFWEKSLVVTFYVLTLFFVPWKCLWMIQTAKLHEIKSREPGENIVIVTRERNISGNLISSPATQKCQRNSAPKLPILFISTLLINQERPRGVWCNGLWGRQAVWARASPGIDNIYLCLCILRHIYTYVLVKNRLNMPMFFLKKIISQPWVVQESPSLAQMTFTQCASMSHLKFDSVAPPDGQIQQYVSFSALFESPTKDMAQKYESTVKNLT